jgi:hypothetical protein
MSYGFADAAMSGLTQGFALGESFKQAQRRDKAYAEDEQIKAAGAGAMDGLAGASAEDRIEAAAMARAEAAMRAGRFDEFTSHWAAAANMRENQRMRLLDHGDRQFAASGDYNAYVPAYNKLRDGIEIRSIERLGAGPTPLGDPMQPVGQGDQQGKFRVTAIVGGKETVRELDEPALKGILNVLRDPRSARAIEAQAALEERKSLLKRGEKTHDVNEDVRGEIAKITAQGILDPSKRFQNVPKDGTFVDTATGRVVAQGVPGSEGAAAGQAQQRLLDNDLVDYISQIEGLGIKDIATGEKKLTADGDRIAQTAQMIRRALPPGTPTAEVIRMARQGQVRPQATLQRNGQTYTGPALVIDGRVLPLRVTEGGSAAPSQPPAAVPPKAPEPGTPTPSPQSFPRVSPAEQAARDEEGRRTVLEPEGQPGVPPGGPRMPAGQVLTPEEAVIAARVAPQLLPADAATGVTVAPPQAARGGPPMPAGPTVAEILDRVPQAALQVQINQVKTALARVGGDPRRLEPFMQQRYAQLAQKYPQAFAGSR